MTLTLIYCNHTDLWIFSSVDGNKSFRLCIFTQAPVKQTEKPSLLGTWYWVLGISYRTLLRSHEGCLASAESSLKTYKWDFDYPSTDCYPAIAG